MRNISRKDFEEYQSYAVRCWHEVNDILLENLQDTLDYLLSSSKSIEVSDFIIDTKLLYGIDLDITFNFAGKASQVWVAESVNYVPNIFYFLEAIISTNYNEYFYYCEEEGPNTFLYVKRIKKDDIQFVHISQRVQFSKHVETEDYKVRQNIVINKNIFIKTFYTSIMNAVKSKTKKDIKRECYYQLNEFEELKNGSIIIEKYLKDLGI